MTKSKSRSPAITELNFVSSLPLEEAVRLIGGLAAPETPVTLTEVDDDHFKFDILYQPDTGTPLASVSGMLRRWEGTYTRLDCSGTVRRESGRRKQPTYPTLAVLAALIIAAVMAIFVHVVITMVLFFSMSIFLAVLIATRPDERLPEGSDKVYFRERDSLFNLLIAVFQAAGDVSLDGSGLDARNDAGVEAGLSILDAQQDRQRKQGGKI